MCPTYGANDPLLQAGFKYSKEPCVIQKDSYSDLCCGREPDPLEEQSGRKDTSSKDSTQPTVDGGRFAQLSADGASPRAD